MCRSGTSHTPFHTLFHSYAPISHILLLFLLQHPYSNSIHQYRHYTIQQQYHSNNQPIAQPNFLPLNCANRCSLYFLPAFNTSNVCCIYHSTLLRSATLRAPVDPRANAFGSSLVLAPPKPNFLRAGIRVLFIKLFICTSYAKTTSPPSITYGYLWASSLSDIIHK